MNRATRRRKMSRALFRRLAAIGLAVLCFNGTSLLAQSETVSLDTVVVTAGREAETLREVSQNMDVITEEEIQKSSATEVKDLLKQYGIQVGYDNSAASGEETITMRGFSTGMHGNDVNSDLLILIDGRRAVGDSLSMQSLNNIARIEIIRGPGAVQYGSSAMGGVINVITKRGGERPQIRLEQGFGSFGEAKTSFFGSGQKDKFDFALGASYYTIDDFVDGSGKKQGNTALDYRVGSMANLGWNFNEFNRLGLSIQASKSDDAGRNNYSGTGAARVLQPRYVSRDLTSFDLLYEGSTEVGDKSWLARYFRGKSTYQIDYAATPTVVGYKSSDSENEFQGAQAQLSWDFDRVGLTGGLDWISYDFDQKQWHIAGNTVNVPSSFRNKPFMSTINDGDYDNYGAFILSKFYLLEDKNLILSGGLRYDKFDVSMNNKSYRTTVPNPNPQGLVFGEITGGDTMDKNYDKILPSVGVAYNPVDFLKLRANYAHAYKVPTPRELAGGYYMMANSPWLGNPYLEPEASQTWELGFDFNRYNLGVSGTYFHTNYDNYMLAHASEPWTNYPFPWLTTPGTGNASWYENVPKATIAGMEWRIAYELGRQFNWGAQVTPYLNWTRLFTYETGDKKKLPNIAEDSLGFGLGLEYEPFGLTVNLDGTYYGAQKVRSYVNQGKPEYAVSRQGGVTVWDMAVVKRLHSFGDDWGEVKVKFAAKNIFDKYYNISEGSSSGVGNEVWMPGSSYYVGLIYDFK
jgi:vitamin B12 transporter